MNADHVIVDVSTLDANNLILMVDVDYRENGAKVSGVITDAWASNTCAVIDTFVTDVAEYEPGAFYKREMPCIMALLYAHQHLKFKYIVVDGYVTLGEDQHLGLGGHLYQELLGTVPVIGVAKTFFHGTPDNQAVYRGDSTKALYVTAMGIDGTTAKHLVTWMHGKHRNPTLLKLVDSQCRAK